MRDLHKIIVHCSASDKTEHDNIETIRKWHVVENGWDEIGYHYVITRDGTVNMTRELRKVGAHCVGHNLDSIGICLTGHFTFTPDQFFSLAWLINDLLNDNPSIAEVRPHNYYNKDKTCPNFELRIFKTSSHLIV